MNKGERNLQTMRVYKKRLKRWLAKDVYVFKNGEKIQHPTIEKVIHDRPQTSLKSTGKPCSCFMCSSNKYKRVEFKMLTRKELEENRCSAYKYLL